MLYIHEEPKMVLCFMANVTPQIYKYLMPLYDNELQHTHVLCQLVLLIQ